MNRKNEQPAEELILQLANVEKDKRQEVEDRLKADADSAKNELKSEAVAAFAESYPHLLALIGTAGITCTVEIGDEFDQFDAQLNFKRRLLSCNVQYFQARHGNPFMFQTTYSPGGVCAPETIVAEHIFDNILDPAKQISIRIEEQNEKTLLAFIRHIIEKANDHVAISFEEWAFNERETWAAGVGEYIVTTPRNKG